MGGHPPRKHLAPDRLRHYEVPFHPDAIPGQLTRHDGRKLRRWGFVAGLALVPLAVTCAWALIVMTGANSSSCTPPSPTTPTPVTAGYTHPGGPAGLAPRGQ